MNKLYIGIDLGKNGAIVTLNDQGEVSKRVTPLIGDELDILELNNYLCSLKTEYKGQVFAGIEDLRAIFGSAAGATFTFGFVCGATEALLVANTIPFVKIRAKKWQAEVFEGIPEQRKPSTYKDGKEKRGSLETKKMALLAQKRLFPSFDPTPTVRAKNPHDGIVDALCIAYYLSKNY
jgi:hypothetical protein